MNLRLSTVLTATLLVACGGGSKNNTPDASAVDAPKTVDAAPVCTPSTVVLGTQDIQSTSTTALLWGGPVTTDLGDGGPANFSFQFYSGIETSLMGTFDLSMGNQADYKTCAACMLIGSTDSTGALARTYYQSGGTLTLTEDPFTNKKMLGTISNLAMVEVTIDPNTSATTLVPNGKCISIGSVTLNHSAVPNAWTCAQAAFAAGTACDCMCGVQDPDCDTTPTPATGCTTNQLCSNALCVDPAPNDTCQLAQALTIGTPKNGNTAGATSNYDLGLEGAACTGFTQKGPDVAYSVALTAATAYTFTLTNVAPQFDPSISLVGPGAPAVCDVSPVVCLAGADAGLKGDGETFAFTPTTTGTYYLIVDSNAMTGTGAFTITVTSP